MPEMNVKIHRGNNQIGGNIVEISTETTRILLDVGVELDGDENERPEIEGLFENAAFDAIFISHYHKDHVGLAYGTDTNIPIYIGERSYKILKATDEYFKRETFIPKGFLENEKTIEIGDIKVTPFLCDHSAFDSYMILCESNEEKILYTGDFRSNGRKSFSALLKRLPEKVDKLICEGTTLSRENYISIPEKELEEQAVKIFKETAGPVFVLQSATNIDRIVTMYRAAKRSGRIFLEEVYMADIASAAGESIPNPAFSDVYAFITNPGRHEELKKYGNRMGKERIAKTPFVMCVRSSMLNYIKKLSELVSFENGVLIYSMWSGYKENENTKRFLDECEKLGLVIKMVHAGGHADTETIKELIKRVSPDEIIPIHTEEPEWFEHENFGKENIEHR